MHAVIRRYRVRLGTVAQAVRYAEKQFVPLVRRIPGFVGCYLMDAGNDVLTSIGLFHTQEGAEAAISLQRDWFRDEWSSFRPLPPEIVAGAVLAQATAEGTIPAERRGLADRRHAAALVPAGPWNGAERRVGSDRRAGGGHPEFAAQAGWQTAAGWRAAG
jgi:hypothetical protein